MAQQGTKLVGEWTRMNKRTAAVVDLLRLSPNPEACHYPQVLGGAKIVGKNPLPTRSRAVANSARFPRRTEGGKKGGRCGNFKLWVMTSSRRERGQEGAPPRYMMRAPPRMLWSPLPPGEG